MKDKKIIIVMCLILFILSVVGSDAFAAKKNKEDVVVKTQDQPAGVTVYVGGSYMQPIMDFSNLVNYGYGVSGGVTLYNFLFDGSAANICGGAYMYDVAHEDIKSFTQYKGGFYLGFSFYRNGPFEVTPFVGIGYYFHRPDGSDNGYDWEFYNDPFFGIKLDCAYFLTENVSLRIMPTYDHFFESKNSSGIFSVDVAFAYSHTLRESKQKVGKGITKFEGKKQIVLSTAGLVFAANKAHLVAANEKNNKLILDRLAIEIKKYTGYRVTIIGHAVNVYWQDKEKAAIEQKNSLLPLSKNRAELIKAELLKRGVNKSRMVTQGVGGSQPLYPFSDIANLWRNRRIEIILSKE